MELAVTVDNGGKNWKGILISFLVIVFICFLIMCSIVLFSPEIRRIGMNTPKKQLITIQEYLNGTFYFRSFNGTFIDDSTLIYKDENANLIVAEIKNNLLKSEVLLLNQTFQVHSISKYFLSSDRKYLLFAQNVENQYRHSFRANYKILQIQKEMIWPVNPPNTSDVSISSAVLDFALWSPKTNAFVFVYEKNIYYQSSVQSIPIAVTSTGKDISNGIPDWLYEEEIFGSNQAIWWSPTGNEFAFIRFNDSRVPSFQFDVYGSDDSNHLYPSTVSIKYPKVNQPNPQVHLFIVRVHDNQTQSQVDVPIQLNPPPEVPTDHYITSVTWVDDHKLMVGYTNRVQNETFVVLCFDSLVFNSTRYPNTSARRVSSTAAFSTLNASSNAKEDENLDAWICMVHVRLRPTQTNHGWIDFIEPVIDSSRQVAFVRHSALQESRGAFKHIAKIDLNSPDKLVFLTSGNYDVVKILGHDSLSNMLYFQAVVPNSPSDRQVYRLDVRSSQQTCITCDLDQSCRYFNAVFSANCSFYVLSCEGPQVPYSQLRASFNNTLVIDLQQNTALKEKLATKLLPSISTLAVPIPGGYNASVKLYLPHNVDFRLTARYPLMVYVYAGPGTQNVNSKFKIDWSTYLTTNKQVVYALIDGRGSGYQGDQLLFELYRRLGTVEIEDQLNVIQYLIDHYSFIDSKRVGIWGWSYGGYASAMALATDKKNLLKCAISVAPVTNWIYYDSAYTERFMGFPTVEDNYDNYTNANLIGKVANIKANKLLLVHGTADDNVHVQHSMLLIKALNRLGTLFKLQIYPDQDHSLPEVYKHLYETLTSYLSDCFQFDFYYDDVVGLRRKRFRPSN